MSERDLRKAVDTWAEAHHLDHAHLERWLALDTDSVAAVFEAAQRLHLRVGQLQTAIELLEELALLRGAPVSAVLARAPLMRILEGSGPAPARARAFVAELRIMRFPRLTRALEQMKSQIAALRLPRTVRVSLPKDLGSDELEIELRVHSAAELRESIHALTEKAQDVERILDLLGGNNLKRQSSGR